MRVLWLTGVIVVLDQATKLLVVETMYRSQSIPLLGDWLSLTYTENPGMAFGITFGPPSLITYFSIFATVVILFYLVSIRRGYAPYRASLALVLGGALGNIIDRVFYGAVLYGERFFQGRVVDFIHVNVWRGYLPDSLPLLGGKYVALFPIWNVADMSIVIGVVGILFFQRMFHSRQARAEAKESFDSGAAEPATSDSYAVATVGTAASDAAIGGVTRVETAAGDSDASPHTNPAEEAGRSAQPESDGQQDFPPPPTDPTARA